MLWVRIPPGRGVLDTTICDNVLSVTCDRSVFFTGYSDFLHQENWPPQYISAILLKVAINTIIQIKSNGWAFSVVRVTRSLVLCVCFVDRCLSTDEKQVSLTGVWGRVDIYL
jgi:hypothetical protein